jgi:uncharacterized protein (TIGR03435 family)
MTFRLLVRLLAGYVCLAAGASGQTGAKAEFEVASIKAAPPSNGHGIFTSFSGGPGSRDPSRFTCQNCSLGMLVMTAYGVKDYQLSAPSWLGSERFDVMAKIPDGATKEQFRAMLQNLLAERFKLVCHQDHKEVPGYELVVAKGGPKLKEAEPEPAGDSASGPGNDAPARPQIGFGSGQGPGPSAHIGVGSGGGTSTSSRSGHATMQTKAGSMEQLASWLSIRVARPVTDATGLTGKYDYKLAWSDSVLSSSGEPDDGLPLAGALQQQLGLRLEPKRGQMEVLVVDSIEKAPTGN